MTRRLSIDPPLASADTWAGRRKPPVAYVADEAKIEAILRVIAAEREAPPTQRRDDVTPLAEHLVLDCLRALKAILPSPYALELMDMISHGYPNAPEHMVRMRRIEALLEISAEDSAS